MKKSNRLLSVIILAIALAMLFCFISCQKQDTEAEKATLFAVYNLKDNQQIESYNTYLVETKIPGIRAASWCSDFKTWKIDKVLGPAVSEPKGELPSDPPYLYIAKIEVSDLDAMLSFLGTDAGKDFVASWSIYIDPTAIFTIGKEI